MILAKGAGGVGNIHLSRLLTAHLSGSPSERDTRGKIAAVGRVKPEADCNVG